MIGRDRTKDDRRGGENEMVLTSTDQNSDERISKVRFVPNGKGLVARFEVPTHETSLRPVSLAPLEPGEHLWELSLSVEASRDPRNYQHTRTIASLSNAGVVPTRLVELHR
jgi:hypothetical protein